MRNKSVPGSRNGAAKLTDDAVRVMRQRYRFASRTDNVATIARDHGVTYYAAYSAIHGMTWGHVR